MFLQVDSEPRMMIATVCARKSSEPHTEPVRAIALESVLGEPDCTRKEQVTYSQVYT